MLTGENGILKKTQKAKIETEKAQIIEQAKVDIAEEQLKNSNSELTKNEIKKS